jgi:hypothetical protein
MFEFFCNKSVYLFQRPFVEFFSAPFWSVVSTRFRQAKNILLMALLSWIIFTVAIGFITPPPHSCWREMNATHQSIERVSYTTTTIKSNVKQLVKRQAITLPTTSIKNLDKSKNIIDQGKNKTNTIGKTVLNSTINTTRKRKTTTIKTTTRSMINNNDEDDDVEDDDEEDDSISEQPSTTPKSNKKQSNTNNFLHINTPQKTIGNPIEITFTNLSLVKPLASPVLYEQKDVRNVFMVFLLLIIIGEFFSAPAITLAVNKSLSLLHLN